MPKISKLLEAKAIFEQLFDKEINTLTLNLDSRKLHIVLSDGIETFVFIMIMVNMVIISYFPSLI